MSMPHDLLETHEEAAARVALIQRVRRLPRIATVSDIDRTQDTELHWRAYGRYEQALAAFNPRCWIAQLSGEGSGSAQQEEHSVVVAMTEAEWLAFWRAATYSA